jgi:multidrug resistance efflux pump
MSLERIFRSRTARLITALTLIAVSIWAFLPYAVYRVAPSAFVNASLKRVTAPISGKLAETLPQKGEFLSEPSSVPLIDARSPDRTSLLNLQRQRVLAKRNSELARSQLKEIVELDTTLSNRVSAYLSATIAHLQREIGETNAERKGCWQELEQLRDVSSRMNQLTKSGYASQIRRSTALAKQEQTLTRCNVADAHIGKLEVELKAARNGVFLGDGLNDVPYSQQQRDQLVLRRQQLETDILKEDLRFSELEAAIEAEQMRFTSANTYRLQLPARHVVWSMEASPGTAVTEGQTILYLANCETRFLAVELQARDFDQINIGDTAYVRLVGDKMWHKGSVHSVLGSAARTEDMLLAAKLPAAGPGKITIELRIPPDAFPSKGSTYCGIGRLAEVRFQRVSFGFLDKVSQLFEGLIDQFRSGDATVVAVED